MDVGLAGLPVLLRRFMAEHPHGALELTIGLSEDLREKLELGVLDLAFVKRTTGDGQGELVSREPLVWIVSPDFVLDPAQPLPLIALAPPAITRKAALSDMASVSRRSQVVLTRGTLRGQPPPPPAGWGG